MVDFDMMTKHLVESGLLYEHPKPPRFTFPQTELLLRKGLESVVGQDYTWLPQYNEIADWMADTNNKGLLLMGSCGQCKTVITQRILPIVFNYYSQADGSRYILNCYDSVYMAKHPDEVISKHLVVIDDVGTEGISVDYGEKRNAFSELVDLAEKKGKLLIITTNFNVQDLTKRYGDRIVDRLRGLCRCVTFNGESLRK